MHWGGREEEEEETWWWWLGLGRPGWVVGIFSFKFTFVETLLHTRLVAF